MFYSDTKRDQSEINDNYKTALDKDKSDTFNLFHTRRITLNMNMYTAQLKQKGNHEES